MAYDSETSQRTIINIVLAVLGFLLMGASYGLGIIWIMAVLFFNKAITTTIATVLEDMKDKAAAAQIQAQAERRNQHMLVQSQQQSAANTAADAEARLKIYRTEIIRKLNSVNNYVELLSEPEHKDNPAHIKQLIADELCDVIAKHPMREFASVVRDNEEVQIKLRNLSERMKSSGIFNEDLSLMVSVIPSKVA